MTEYFRNICQLCHKFYPYAAPTKTKATVTLPLQSLADFLQFRMAVCCDSTFYSVLPRAFSAANENKIIMPYLLAVSNYNCIFELQQHNVLLSAIPLSAIHV